MLRTNIHKEKKSTSEKTPDVLHTNNAAYIRIFKTA